MLFPRDSTQGPNPARMHDHDHSPRVVVSGIGLRTGLGMSAGETWANLKAGRHGFRILDLPVAPGMPPHVGCPVGQTASEVLLGAAREACRDAGLVPGCEGDGG